MSSSNPKFRAASALVVILGLAFAVSCRGFFVKATLQSIALQPQTPSFGVGYQQSMQAWGTDSNNNRYQLTNGVVWSLSNPSTGTVATIDTSTGTMTGVNAGTITVTASDQGLTGTTTATVAELVTALTISPTSTSVIDDGTQYAAFTILDQSGNDISSLVTLTAYQGTTAEPQIACGYQTQATDGKQDCLPQASLVTTPTAFSIVVTYSGYTGAQVSATLTVDPATAALRAPAQNVGRVHLAKAGEPPQVRGQ